MLIAGFWYAVEPILSWVSLLVASSGSDEGSAFVESEEAMRDKREFFRGCLGNGERRQKVKSF